MTDDQDIGDWKRQRNRKSAKQLSDRLTRQRRDDADELLRRYEDERVDDRESVPRID